MTKDNEVSLKVMEAMQEEAYKGIVRIDSTQMKTIGIHAGDIVEIEGARKTVGIVDRAYPSDIGQSIIRMDGILRRNAKTGIGEQIKVRKTDYKEAKKITIAPAQKGVMIQIQGNPEGIKRSLLGRAVVKGDILSLGGATRRSKTFRSSGSPFEDIFEQLGEMMGGAQGGFMGSMGSLKFVVADSNPNGPIIITENTQLKISSKAMDITDDNSSVPDVNYEDIGGLEEEVKKIRELVEVPLKYPTLFNRLGIQPPKGVLMHGIPGTGKTLLAKAVANESEANFIELKLSDMIGGIAGQTEKNFERLFEEAKQNAPTIIFIDEIDSFAFKRSDKGSNEFLNTPVSEMLKHMDGLKDRGNVIVVAATNRPEALDPALRRPGRFDRELIINVPSKKGRLAILKIHTRNMPLAKDVILEEFSEKTHGFVGADLEALCKEAAMSVLRRYLPKVNLKEKKLPQELIDTMIVTKEDFEEGLKFVQPSALREVSIEIPDAKWTDIGGMEGIKEQLKEAVEWPLKHSASFYKMGIRPPKGVLLYGPPGTGKTLLAKAVANESGANFIQINGPELQKEGIIGRESEHLRKIFKRAREVSPCVIFLDELDSFAKGRGTGHGAYASSNEALVNTLLTEMDGLVELKDVVVLAATNRPDLLDPALLRPGRFDRSLLVNTPDIAARKEIFKIHTASMPIAKDVKLDELVNKTKYYSGADIEGICREAGMLALRKDINSKEVKMKNFEDSLKNVKSSITEKDMEKYKKIEEEYFKTARGAAIKEMSYMG
jgi:transitional endoplasmic reticulum ATPase